MISMGTGQELLRLGKVGRVVDVEDLAEGAGHHAESAKDHLALEVPHPEVFGPQAGVHDLPHRGC